MNFNSKIENNLSNFDNMTSLYHFSVPNVKMFYPEPFIASTTFLHYDLWFIHISVYQYWLWFFFIFIIVFFTITFLTTLRWCNLRVRPQRETRGVSRSKCGDAITSAVPVAWACSIIIHESTDAIDFYDGFGTTEMAVGVRAYQWGWEYYYPKDVDLNYKVKNSNNVYVGKGLSYPNQNSDFSSKNNFWNFYKNKDTYDGSITPAHVLLNSSKGDDFLNIHRLNNFGTPKQLIRTAFKNVVNTRYIHFDNELNYSIFNNNSGKLGILKKISNSTELNPNSVGVLSRPQTYLTSSSSVFNNSRNFTNTKSVNKFINNNISKGSYDVDINKINLLMSLNEESSNSNLNLFLSNNLINTESKSFLINNESGYIDNVNDFRFSFFSDFYKNQLNLEHKSNQNSHFDKNYSSGVDRLENEELFSETNAFPDESKVDSKDILSGNSNTVDLRVEKLPQDSNLSTYYKDGGITSSKNSSSSLSEKSNLTENNYIVGSNKKLIKESTCGSFEGTTPFSTSTNISYFYENFENIVSSKNDSSSVYLWSEYVTNNTKSLNKSLKLKLLSDVNESVMGFKFPLTYLYADLDFKRIESLEMFEDVYWDSLVSEYLVSEYKDVKVNSSTQSKWFFDHNNFYDTDDLEFKSSNYAKKIPFFKNLNSRNSLSNLEIKPTEGMYDYSYITKDSLSFFFNNDKFNENLENSFEFYKNYTSLFSQFNVNNLQTFITNNINPISDQLMLGTFWSEYEIKSLINFKDDVFDPFAVSYEYKYLKLRYLFEMAKEELVSDSTLSFPFPSYKDLHPDEVLSNESNSHNRFSSNTSVLDSYKSLMVMENAVGKVFRSAFDEGRSNVNFKDFSKSNNNLPFLTNNLPNFKKLLHKNNTNFVDTNLYFSKYKVNLNNNPITNVTGNYFTYEFPFFVAFENDSIRYAWMDWFSMSNKRVAKALDTAGYNLYGSKSIKNSFDFSSSNSEDVNKTENYLAKLSHARKVYLPSWTFSLYWLSKSKMWSSNSSTTSLLKEFSDKKSNLGKLQFMMDYSKWFYGSNNSSKTKSNYFAGGSSSSLVPSRNYWRTTNSYSSFNYYVSSTLDILIKREFLIRKLISFNNSLLEVPKSFIANPTNPVIMDLKSDLIPNSSVESSTEDFKNKSLRFVNKLNYSKPYGNIFSNDFTNLFKGFLKTNLSWGDSQDTSILKRSQYKQMRKSISNMIRIQADKAVAMPTDTRIQILTVSKDIIHSWAIPSAGIKIDCIPGYSSHKVTIFLLSGVYWGQCMEICGRFHHWMPIVVYFMKRDLFLLWCIHFVLKNKPLNDLPQNSDKVLSDFVKTVSFDNNSWSNEIL